MNEIWFSWLTKKLNSYEAFKYFSTGENPENVAYNFISENKIAISKVFEKFDEEDKDTLDHFQKLTECEWHVFRILKTQLEKKNNVISLDFKKKKSRD